MQAIWYGGLILGSTPALIGLLWHTRSGCAAAGHAADAGRDRRQLRLGVPDPRPARHDQAATATPPPGPPRLCVRDSAVESAREVIVNIGVIYADIDRSDDWHATAAELLSTAPATPRASLVCHRGLLPATSPTRFRG